jgi:glycerol uptake facilitator-like aquaporin
VTLTDRAFGGLSGALTAAYIAAQFAGAVVGVMLANLMFELPAVDWASTERFDQGLWLGEAVATFGLLLIVFSVVRSQQAQLAPFAVGAYIFAAIFFTSSTSFANPAVTVGRMLSDTSLGLSRRLSFRSWPPRQSEP